MGVSTPKSHPKNDFPMIFYDIYHRNIKVHRNSKVLAITVDCLHSQQGIESHHEINVLTLEYHIYRGKYTNIEHD